MTKNKYVEYINDQLVFISQREISKTDLFALIPNQSKYLDKGNFCFDLTFHNGDVFNICYFAVKASGVYQEDKKRIQVSPNQSVFSQSIPICAYLAGNKNCFIRFSDIRPIINNKNSSKSVWINFNYIYYCLKFDKQLVDKCQNNISRINYLMYFSTSFENLLYLNKNDYVSLRTNELTFCKQEISAVRDKNESLTELSSEIDLTAFTPKEKDKTNIEILDNDSKSDKLDGRKAESIFFDKLKNEGWFIAKNLGIKMINNYEWVNQFKESYKPYDFVINNTYYVDVKGTKQQNIYFEVSDEEWVFRNSTEEQGNHYFIVNITNLINEYDLKWLFFDNEKINNMVHKTKTKHIFKGDKNE